MDSCCRRQSQYLDYCVCTWGIRVEAEEPGLALFFVSIVTVDTVWNYYLLVPRETPQIDWNLI